MTSPTRPLLVTVLLLASLGVALRAQTPAPPCAVWSNAENRCLDAPKAQPPVPVSAAVRNDPARQAAIAALRAVASVLDGGANTTEFKKYYLDAKIKVDALPEIPENAAIVDVSGWYADAATLLIASQVHEISGDEVRALKQKYAGTAVLSMFVDKMPDLGVSRTSPRLEQDTAAIWIRGSAQALLHFAGEKLAAVGK
jgi:hypothetical protein